MERKGRGREKSRGREVPFPYSFSLPLPLGKRWMESRGGERGRVENLLHWFMGDRRPCLTKVNIFLRFDVTQTTLGGFTTCKFPVSAMNVTLSKIINWLTLGKVVAIIQRVTFLLDHCVLLIVESCLDATAEETTSACKNAEKYAI